MWSRVRVLLHTYTKYAHTTKKGTTDRDYRQGIQTGYTDRVKRQGQGLGSFHNFTSVVWIYSSVPKDAISDSCT